LLWFPPPPAHVNDFTQIKRRLLREIEAIVPNYPDAKYYIVADTLEGLSSPDFFPEAKRLRVQITVPIRFFDLPFRYEESEGRKAATKVGELLDVGRVRGRIPQPYSVLEDDE
jgi:hypothetical protein